MAGIILAFNSNTHRNLGGHHRTSHIMKPRKGKILVADDEGYIVKGLHALLYEEGYEVATAFNGTEALERLQNEGYAVVLVDLTLPDIDGIELLTRMRERHIMTEAIIITGKGTVSTAVEAMKKGAYDYLEKPVEPDRLKTIIMKALQHYHLVISHKRLEKELKNLISYEELIGQSKEMLKVYKLIDAVADTTANVVITGESGTGKELVARAVHKKSSRREGPFVPVNCSAFPMEILENELFGHEQGAFTGALKEKPGCFELADNGTLFLDEICDMPLEIQAKMLRALEERRFRRLGGKNEIEVDVRVLSASNKKLEKALEEKMLREDIYYRLSVVEIEMPPLRERTGDIPLLMNEFLEMFREKNDKKITSFSPRSAEILNRYHWPGNVRELKNTIERAVVLCKGQTIQVTDLPKRLIDPDGSKLEVQIPIGTTLELSEREMILKTLEHVNNNKTRAAQVLGISLKTLHNKLNQYKSENLM
ncbi:sigma-54-dependent Fis family transcriptional regulator [candidate division KSB1 bacterium]|nr:sigma-54-dependent Fis family transcriptional regulator [candidate division KSB1 bacterium]NIR71040.1 sigma-54-dependent Fis family transcriptional regulator [candidate division KSB1 bacterium]NIS24747.1 sigma-54-dependent Fis family transcriptional regulator [candidate division KSB1 bacterium]NIT71651.1 sigma-54-dependent Fis family transcriptional regulator [candidate division KSB1 bacterium]NIU25358.1 sigma-54-dependent Fis family transcriptional regulator [candidate division KSB1 bacteri